MKFNASVKESFPMKEFISIINSISKMTKECVVRITEHFLYFIIPDQESYLKKPNIWCKLNQSYFFREYFFVGFESDQILLNINPNMLSKSISYSVSNIRFFRLQLTNKQTPCLTVRIETAQANSMQNRKYVHDVPVDIINKESWTEYEEPVFDPTKFDITFTVASLKNLRNICDRMKCIDNNLNISITPDGKLDLHVKTPFIKISANFPDTAVQVLKVSLTENHQHNTSSFGKFETCVDVRKIVQISNWCNLQNSRIVFHMASNDSIKIDLEQQGSLLIQCVVPKTEV